MTVTVVQRSKFWPPKPFDHRGPGFDIRHRKSRKHAFGIYHCLNVLGSTTELPVVYQPSLESLLCKYTMLVFVCRFFIFLCKVTNKTQSIVAIANKGTFFVVFSSSSCSESLIYLSNIDYIINNSTTHDVSNVWNLDNHNGYFNRYSYFKLVLK